MSDSLTWVTRKQAAQYLCVSTKTIDRRRVLWSGTVPDPGQLRYAYAHVCNPPVPLIYVPDVYRAIQPYVAPMEMAGCVVCEPASNDQAGLRLHLRQGVPGRNLEGEFAGRGGIDRSQTDCLAAADPGTESTSTRVSRIPAAHPHTDRRAPVDHPLPAVAAEEPYGAESYAIKQVCGLEPDERRAVGVVGGDVSRNASRGLRAEPPPRLGHWRPTQAGAQGATDGPAEVAARNSRTQPGRAGGLARLREIAQSQKAQRKSAKDGQELGGRNHPRRKAQPTGATGSNRSVGQGAAR